MKKFICVLCGFLLCVHTLFPLAANPATSARAEGENTDPVYACALSHDVYLYAEENENSGLFLIPYTYYVKVLSSGLEYSYVQYSTNTPPYQAVYGYCKSEQLQFVDFTPERPFLYQTIDVVYRLEDYADFFKEDDVFSTMTVSYAYYGDYTVGSSTYWYVCLNGQMGYLPKTADITYELNEDFRPLSPEAEGSAPEAATLPVKEIIFAAVLVIFTLGVGYYLLRPRADSNPVSREEFEL